MGSFSVWHWMIFLVIALLLFGGSGKISSIMGDVAKGIKSFKKGMTEEMYAEFMAVVLAAQKGNKLVTAYRVPVDSMFEEK